MKGSNEILTAAVLMGEALLKSGAEVHRVEDSVERICKAYGALRVDVFAIPSAIIVTLQLPDEDAVTQTMRIHSSSNDLNKVDRLNNLSRYICHNKPELSLIRTEINKISSAKGYSVPAKILIYFFVSASFCIFFGGNAFDALFSGIIGIVLLFVMLGFEKIHSNRFFSNIASAAIAGALAVICVFFGLGQNSEYIIIGNIMLLIPGLALTNGMRDFVAGDILAGVLRLSEAVLHAAGIALGAAAATSLLGGVLL